MLLIQHFLICTIFAIGVTSAYETINATNGTANKTGKYEAGKSSNNAVVVNTVNCFSGDSQVQLTDGTWKQISKLQSGDLAYSYDGSKVVTTEMVMMLDQQPSTDTLFYTLKTESGESVSLTPLHLIAIGSSNAIPIYKPAKDAQIGDLLFILSIKNVSSSPIVEIIIEIKRGYFSPLTTEGVLFVNGILSSCYANVKSHDAAHFYMSPLIWYYHTGRYLSINDPFRTNGQEGIHWMPKLMFAFGQQFRPSTLLV